MSINLVQPTSYPGVNIVLHRLRSDVQTVLGDYFVGLYLYGSLATGDFSPESSDIDFLVVTTGKLPDEMIPALETMHLQLAGSGLKWATKLEGSYVPRKMLRRYDPTGGPYPQINEGRFYVAGHGSDWIIQRHTIRERELIVAGPSLRELIDPVTTEDLRHAVRGNLQEWWSPILEDSSWLERSEYQTYAVLTMCRALYTLEWGAVVSKPASARWAQQTLGEKWSALIAEALKWPSGESFAKREETLTFIRYTVERSL